MTTLEYFKTLAMELRKRRLSEERVADVLRELQSHLQDTGVSLEEAFGSPQAYAGRFPQGTTVAPGSKTGYLAAGVLIFLLALQVVFSLVLGLSIELGGTNIYMAAAFLVTGLLIGWGNGRLKAGSGSGTDNYGRARTSVVPLPQAHRKNRVPSGGGARLALRGAKRANSGCAQCAHLGSGTGSYIGRTVLDSACFPGSPVFSGPGMQFESHLGHVFPCQGHFWASDRVDNAHALSAVSYDGYRSLRICRRPFLWPDAFLP
jgi:hypothetical protein